MALAELLTSRAIRRPLVSLLVLVGAVAATAGCGRAQPVGDGPGAENRPDEAVVRVVVDDCGGGLERRAGGVAVGPDVVATVAHTFALAASFHLVDHAQRELEAELVWIDVDRDVALVRPSTPMASWLTPGDTADGTELSVMTLPPEQGPTVKAARLIRHVTATLDGVGQRAALEIDAGIEAGDSGSPVVDGDGRLVGLVFAASRTEQTANEQQAWAVAASEITRALIQPRATALPLAC